MKTKIFRTTVFFLMMFFVLGISISCSRSRPEILFGFVKLTLYETEQGEREQYSFFIIPDDEDGIENLDVLYLYHDAEQLRWRIDREEWVSHTHEGRDWIGTRSISGEEDVLPRGIYRAVLVNRGGESSERRFTFDGNIRFPFPEIYISDGAYNVNSQWPVNRLVGYDAQGAFITVVTLNSLSGAVAELRLPSSVRSVALWAEDEDNFVSAFTFPAALN